MSDTNAKLTATLKAGSTFDSPWIVVYADTPQELSNTLDAIHLTGLGTKVASVAKGFQAEYAVSELGTSHVATTVNQPAPAQPAAQPVTAAAQQAYPAAAPLQIEQPAAAGAAPACHHGPKVYREAKPGSGKSWKGWFCPSPRGTADQCPPEFVKDR